MMTMDDEIDNKPLPWLLDISPTEQSLDQMLARRLALTPEAPFVRFERGAWISYREFYEATIDVAFALQMRGVKKGDRVLTMTENSLEAVSLWFAIELLGAIDCPINPAFVGEPLRHVINLVEAELIILSCANLKAIEDLDGDLDHCKQIFIYPPADTGSDQVRGLPVSSLKIEFGGRRPGWQPGGARFMDLSSILFTSGTTGPSKGVMVTHAMACTTALQAVRSMRYEAGDIIYCAHPLFHMSPRFCAFYAAMLVGACVTLDRGFNAEHWIDRIRESGSTATIGHGPLLEMIYAQPARPTDGSTNLRRIGSAPVPKHIAEGFEKRFNLKALECWGMTEINIPCWVPYDEPLRPGTAGRITDDDYEFAIINSETDEPLPKGQIGEFVVRPRRPWIITPGYWGNTEATCKAWRNSWFHTGDSGYITEDGWIYFIDRLGDRIRRRAENISSFDIEAAARTHFSVLDAAAVGVPSGYSSDDDIKLCVTLKNRDLPLDASTLLRFLADKLPHHMVPRYIEILDALPRTPTQKIRKSKLRTDGVGPHTWDRKAAGISLKELKH